jgi:hypothetical protein
MDAWSMPGTRLALYTSLFVHHNTPRSCAWDGNVRQPVAQWQRVCAMLRLVPASALSPVIQHVNVVRYGHGRRLQPGNGDSNTPRCHVACGIIFEIDQ